MPTTAGMGGHGCPGSAASGSKLFPSELRATAIPSAGRAGSREPAGEGTAAAVRASAGPERPDGGVPSARACAPPSPGAIKASPPAAARRSRFAASPPPAASPLTWTLRPAPALRVVPAPALTPASARDANAPPARSVAAPAALQSVRNAPRIVCAKVERGQRQRRRSATAPTEMRTCPRCEQCVNSISATSPCEEAQLCIPFLC